MWQYIDGNRYTGKSAAVISVPDKNFGQSKDYKTLMNLQPIILAVAPPMTLNIVLERKISIYS